MTASQSLIYFDKCKPWYGSTICLSGPNQNHLKILKKYLEKILKYSRDIVLEKEYLFLSDGDSKDDEVSPYLLPKIGIGKPSLKYVKVLIRQSIKEDVLSSYLDRENNENNSGDEIDDNIYGGNEAQVKKNMHHTWGKPEKKNIEFYSENDMTLGAFLRKTASEAVEKWDYCKEKNYKHVTDIYHGDGYIEISVSIKDHHPLLQNKADVNDIYKKNYGGKLNEPNSKIRELIDVDTNAYITMHEEWKKCKNLVIEKKILSSDLQEYSFTKFIEQYFYNPDIVVQNCDEVGEEDVSGDEESSWSDNQSHSSSSDCEHRIHRNLIRTFTIKGIKIKLKYRKVSTYSIDIVKFREIDNSEYLKTYSMKEFDQVKDNFPWWIKDLHEEFQRVKNGLVKLIKWINIIPEFLEFYKDIYNLLITIEGDLEKFEKDAFREIGKYAGKEKEKNDIFEIIMLRKKVFIQLFNFIWVLYKSKRLIKRVTDSHRKYEPIDKRESHRGRSPRPPRLMTEASANGRNYDEYDVIHRQSFDATNNTPNLNEEVKSTINKDPNVNDLK